ncbi:MAG: ABC transporter permease [Planctomycetia bacterium]|nr:ABC transporter permease [Planctomycetia bacterium]
MILSPIFHIELLTVGRRRRYFFARVIYAFVLLITMWFCYLAAFSSFRDTTLRSQSMFAFSFFASFSWIQLLVVLGLTPAMIAGTISVEHERKTIDYLLTTQLSDSEIALGKFAARLWSVIMQLAVGLPILALALTLGGVGPGQMLASFGVSFLVLCVTATLSLAISARAQRSREAITRAYLVIIALLAVPPMAWGIMEGIASQTFKYPILETVADGAVTTLRWLIQFHPFVFLGSVLFDGRGGPSSTNYGIFAGGYLAASALLALSAVIGVRRFYLKIAGRAANDSIIKKLGALPAIFTRKRRAVGEQAMLWKEMTSQRTAIRLGWSGRIATILLFLMIAYVLSVAFIGSITDIYWRTGYNGRGNPSPMELASMTGVPMIFGLMLLLVTSNSAGSITGEREKDTWLTLMSTPLEGKEIVRAKILATLYGVRYWYATILIAWLLTAILRPSFLFLLPLLIPLHLVAALFAACLGLRCSLQAATSLKSMGLALAIMILGVSIAPLILTGFVALAASGGEETVFFASFSLPVLLSACHPTMFEWTHSGIGADRASKAFLGGGFVSLLVYVGCTALLYANLVDAFDRYAGRSTRSAGGPRLRPRTAGGFDRAPSTVAELASQAGAAPSEAADDRPA